MPAGAPRSAIVDGTRVGYGDATVHVSDLGLRRAYAVFEFFRVEEGVPLFLDAHLARLARSTDLVGLRMSRDVAAVADDVHELIAADDLGRGAVQILVTGGPSDDGFTPTRPTCIVSGAEVPPRATEPVGAALLTHRHVREFPEAKNTSYLTAMRLAPAMRAAGAIDVLYHDGERVAEGARSAVAIVVGTTFITRREGVLESVSMSNLLMLARRRMDVEERSFTMDELSAADEVITTGSVRGVAPVTAVDGRPVGDGAIGPHARALFAAYEAHVRAYVDGHRPGPRGR